MNFPRTIAAKLIVFQLFLLLTGLVGVGWISFVVVENAVLDNAILTMQRELDQKINASEKFHEKAQSDMRISMGNTIFREYFQLPETLNGNHYENGVIQFTPAQKAIRHQLDHWILSLHKQLPISETCLIDRTGQEHLRVTRGQDVADAELSNDENDSPFFAPTFRMKQGEVFIAPPYISSDTHEWVFSYSSPIVLDDGSKPAFYHYEIALSLFNQLISEKNPPGEKAQSTPTSALPHARFFILEPTGHILADSQETISFSRKPGPAKAENNKENHEYKNYFPRPDTISREEAFRQAMERMQKGEKGHAIFKGEKGLFYLVYQPMPTFKWSMGIIKSYDALLAGQTPLSTLRIRLLGISLLLTALAMLLTWLGAHRLTRPLQALTVTAKQIATGELVTNLPREMPDDEVKVLGLSMKNMADSLCESIQTSKIQVTALQACVSELEGISYTMLGDSRDGFGIKSRIGGAFTLLQEKFADVQQLARDALTSIDDVSQETGKLAATLEEMAASTRRTEANAASLAHASEQIALNLDQVMTTQEQVSKSVTNVTQSVETIAVAFSKIRTLCVTAKDRSHMAENHIRDTNAMVDHLVGSMQAISEVVELIKSISKQTTMLALNASVEASVAGEWGRGFAVVASEVKILAKKTVDASKIISDQIAEIQTRSQSVFGATTQLRNLVRDIIQANDNITQSVDEQNRVIGGINQEIQEVNDATANMMLSAREIHLGSRNVASAAVNVSQESSALVLAAQDIANSGQEVAGQAEQVRAKNNTIISAWDQLTEQTLACTDGLRELGNLAEFSKSSIQHMGHVVKTIDNIADNLRKAGDGLHTGQPPFDLEGIMTNYLIVISGLEKMASGRISFFDDKEVKSQWEALMHLIQEAHLPDAPELAKRKQIFYQLVKQAFDHGISGQREEASQIMAQIEQHVAELFRMLEDQYLQHFNHSIRGEKNI
ncbi:MAG: methyl-accepting chemotaxis protein [Magnetococcus sp. DMHC-1]|nr:HAMP domain-containing protein [Magnetococcales bacterium]